MPLQPHKKREIEPNKGWSFSSLFFQIPHHSTFYIEIYQLNMESNSKKRGLRIKWFSVKLVHPLTQRVWGLYPTRVRHFPPYEYRACSHLSLFLYTFLRIEMKPLDMSSRFVQSHPSVVISNWRRTSKSGSIPNNLINMSFKTIIHDDLTLFYLLSLGKNTMIHYIWFFPI